MVPADWTTSSWGSLYFYFVSVLQLFLLFNLPLLCCLGYCLSALKWFDLFAKTFATESVVVLLYSTVLASDFDSAFITLASFWWNWHISRSKNIHQVTTPITFKIFSHSNKFEMNTSILQIKQNHIRFFNSPHDKQSLAKLQDSVKYQES